MAVGAGAAYKGYQKLDNGMSQSLQRLTGIKAQENAAEKLAEERAGVREQGRVDQWKKDHPYSHIKVESRAFGTDKEHARYMANGAVERARGYSEQADKLRLEGKTGEANRMYGKYQKVKDSIELYNNTQLGLKEGFEEFGEVFEAGGVSAADSAYTDLIEKTAGRKGVPFYNDDDELMFRVPNKDGEGNDAGFKDVLATDIIDKKISYIQKVPVTGEGGLVKQVLDFTGARSTISPEGDYMVTSKPWDTMAQEGAEGFIDETMNSNSKMIDLYFQATGKTKFGDDKFRRREGVKEEFTADDKKAVKDWFLKKVKNAYGVKNEQKIRSKTVTEENAAAAKVAAARLAASTDKGTGKTKLKGNVASDRVYYGNSPNKKSTPNARQYAINSKTVDVQSLLVATSYLSNDELVTKKYNTIIVTDGGKLFLSSADANEPDLAIKDGQKTSVATLLGYGSGDEMLEASRTVEEKEKGKTVTTGTVR